MIQCMSLDVKPEMIQRRKEMMKVFNYGVWVAVLFALVASVSYGDNNLIYITQSGTGLTMNIDQIGNTNKVGTSQTRASLSR